MKKFVLTFIEEEKDGKSIVKYDAQNDGFTVLEVAGILNWKCIDILGSLKPVNTKSAGKGITT